MSLLSKTEQGYGATGNCFKVEDNAPLALTITDTVMQHMVMICLLGAHLGLNIIKKEDKSKWMVEDYVLMVEIRVEEK